MLKCLSSFQDKDNSSRTKRRTRRESSEPSSKEAADNGEKVVFCTAHSRLEVLMTIGGSSCKRMDLDSRKK